MVDVGDRAATVRRATARGTIHCAPEAALALARGTLAKGDALAAARVAGIMAAKRTPDLLPLCHPLILDHVSVDLRVDVANNRVDVAATVRCTGRTGVEMEALTAVTVAALTIMDMAKPVDPWMTLDRVGLEAKDGGRSGSVERPARPR